MFAVHYIIVCEKRPVRIRGGRKIISGGKGFYVFKIIARHVYFNTWDDHLENSRGILCDSV